MFAVPPVADSEAISRKLGLSLSLYCCDIVLTKILMLYPDRAAS